MLLGSLLDEARPALPCCGPVTDTGGGLVDAQGDRPYMHVPLFAPYGLCGAPPQGAACLLVPMEDGCVCPGVLGGGLTGEQPPPGEVRLFSQGGASIALQNNGDVVINGLTITRDGRLLEKEGF